MPCALPTIVSYSYDANGNLTAKQLGGRTDTYAYDVQNNLTAYNGYDGYRQTYGWNALGEMYEKSVSGNADRTLLEEALFGEQLNAYSTSEECETTRYIYDSAMSIPQVLTETTGDETITYEYGLERIASYSSDTKTQYIHDAGGSVVQTLCSTLTSKLEAASASPTIVSYSYTPFGEQLGEAVSAFGYNAEYFDAATGMIHLRARQYEPTMMRFNQEDIIRGSVSDPISLNRYLYCHNNPLSFSDPSGMTILSKLKSAAKSAVTAVKSTAKAVTAKAVSSAAKVTATVAKTVNKAATTMAKASNAVSTAAKNVAKNSNSKIVKTLATGVSKAADTVNTVSNKVATVAKKVETAATKVAEKNDKIASDAWNDAKTNFASAAKDFNEAAKEAKQKVSCALSNMKLGTPTTLAVSAGGKLKQLGSQNLSAGESPTENSWYKKVLDALYGAGTSVWFSAITGFAMPFYEVADFLFGTSFAYEFSRGVEQRESDWAEQVVTNRDWYYGGKICGDIISMIGGIVEGLIGVATIAEGLTGTAAGALITVLTSETGVGAIAGSIATAISLTLVLEGTYEVVLGGSICLTAYNRLGNDIDNYKWAVKNADNSSTSVDHANSNAAENIDDAAELLDEDSYGQSLSISDQKMYQLGKHYNKHGKEMGFSSKKEYEQAARDFFNNYKDKAEIYEGTFNSEHGSNVGMRQIIVRYDGKQLIISKESGQLIDFYEGTNLSSFIDIERVQ